MVQNVSWSTIAHLLAISLCEQPVQIALTEVLDDLFLSSRHYATPAEYT
jgi:hypothetical protein